MRNLFKRLTEYRPEPSPALIERQRKAVRRRAIGAGIVTAAGVAGFGVVSCSSYVHGINHPELTVGVEHHDVGELKKLLAGSALSLYFVEGEPSDVMNEGAQRAIIDMQLQNGIDVVDAGHVREGDKTWRMLVNNQAEPAPEGLPEDCYDHGSVVCVVKDTENNRGTVYVMGNGKLKYVLNDVGIGKASEPSDEGTFTVDKGRMEEIHFSDGAGYDGTFMYNFIPYGGGGEGFHYSQYLGEVGIDKYPGSGGCITIGSEEVAERLFRQVKHSGGDVTVVVGEDAG